MLSNSKQVKLMKNVYRNLDKGVPWIIDFEVEGKANMDVASFYWQQFGELWYPHRSSDEQRVIVKLLSAEKEYKRKFFSQAELGDFLAAELDKIPDTVKVKCSSCGASVDIFQIDQHKNSKKCKQNQLKACQTVQYCKVCDRSFATAQTFKRHCKTAKHKQKAAVFIGVKVQPTICKICDSRQDSALKFRRHLKNSKKCHRKCAGNLENQTTWVSYYNAFGCKFPPIQGCVPT